MSTMNYGACADGLDLARDYLAEAEARADREAMLDSLAMASLDELR